jgi:hypothetical protein
MNRRRFVGASFAAGAFALVGGGVPRFAYADEAKPVRNFAPVRISRERLIRTLVGLRP